MLVVETVVRLRREYAAGKPIKAICRDLRLSRKVVRKAIRAEEGAFSYQRTTQPFPKIGPVRDRLVQLLTENEARPRRDRLRLTRVWDLLVQEGYDGSYDSVRRYAARWREETKTAPGDGGTDRIRLELQDERRAFVVDAPKSLDFELFEKPAYLRGNRLQRRCGWFVLDR